MEVRVRRWLRIAALSLAGGIGLVALAGAAVVSPYVRDDLALDWVVRAVALDWRDFGRDAAMTRLQYELDHQGVGMYVGDDHCALQELESGARRVRCAWGVQLGVPGTRMALPLTFESRADLDAQGNLL